MYFSVATETSFQFLTATVGMYLKKCDAMLVVWLEAKYFRLCYPILFIVNADFWRQSSDVVYITLQCIVTTYFVVELK